MDKQLARYIRNHIVFVTSVVIVGFTLLAAGEYYLYRQTMHLNKMISEGFMQVKSLQEVGRMKDADTVGEDVMMENKDDRMIDDEESEIIK